MQKSSQYALNQIMSPESHIKGGSLMFTGMSGVTGSVCTPIFHNHKTGQLQSNTDIVLNCKGAQVITVDPSSGVTGADGVLQVHLVEDADGVWYPLELKSGKGPAYAQFDYVGGYTGANSTVKFDNSLLIFPADYSREGQP